MAITSGYNNACGCWLKSLAFARSVSMLPVLWLATVEAADTQATLGPNHRRHSGKTESNLKFKHYKSALSREWIQSVTIPYTKRNFAHYKRYR